MQHSPNGVTTYGIPIGTDTYITEVVASRAASAKAQVDTLLPKAGEICFVVRILGVTHGTFETSRTMEFSVRNTDDVETVIHAAVASIFRLEQGLDPTWVLADVELALGYVQHHPG